ncbi:helix-turn-helix domain-containing protein [Salinarimonas soli]|uniref:Helix-turn-helix domain-containing protein n=1 Tax=Salinarimonas soli TaxID=1638099 RepID=A0A5B2V8L1_9HYPH|nr:helix-turn-helix domain-containing protein [Salinarimonas soli]KAA2234905.1 helix-turn-helix domain-containing protein [Salinarimonas soli]
MTCYIRPAPNPVDQRVGARIRERRQALGLTQAELGAAIGLSMHQILKYEKGRCRVSATNLSRLSAVLGAPTSFFFGKGAPDGRSGVSDGASYDLTIVLKAEPLAAEMMRAFLRISDVEVRREVLAMVEAASGRSAVPRSRTTKGVRGRKERHDSASR